MIIADLHDLGGVGTLGAARYASVLRIQHVHVSRTIRRDRRFPLIIHGETQTGLWRKPARAGRLYAGRLVRLVDRAAATMVHVEVDRITPMAVPLMVIVGREAAPEGSADEALLIEAEALAAEAMRVD